MQIDTSNIPEGVRFIAAALSGKGHKSWIVGGCVRDLLRGAGDRISDWDLTTEARPEQVMRLFEKVIPTGIQHGTVTVMYEGEGFEVTTLRGEGAYSDGRRPDEIFFVDDIEEDLARRDFTVNAIAADPWDGKITDPFGGVEDLRRGVLRAVGDAHERFSEDGLRVLRAARFCAVLQYELDEHTSNAIRANLETFSKVARERVLAEWVKAVEKAQRPSVAFEIMRHTGILELVGGPLADLDHERFFRAMARLDRAPRYFEHSVAAMLLESEASRADMERWLRELKTSNSARELILQIVHGLRGAPSFHEMLGWSHAQIRKWASRLSTTSRVDAQLVYLSNPHGGSKKHSDALAWLFAEVLHSSVPLELKGLAVTGDELQEHLGIPPSRQLGEMLKKLLDFVLDDPARNEKQLLLSHARSLL
jgi:tRNA nucleotidyltransferase (CCA-adding enzyme)